MLNKMKKLLGILVLSLLWCNVGFSQDKSKVCTYPEVLNKVPPCDQSFYLKQTLNNIYSKYLKPPEVSDDDWKKLILKRIKEWDAGADQRNQEYEADRKNEIDLKCEILAGRANNSSSAKKIYKKCMKAEGY